MRTRFETRRQASRVALGIGYVTQREIEAIEHYAMGGTPKSIGPLMRIDYRSVESIMRNARDRTGSLTNCQLVALYAEVHPIRGRGRSSNREISAGNWREPGASKSSVESLSSDVDNGTAPSRVL